MSDALKQVYELDTKLGGLTQLNSLLKEHNSTVKDIRKSTVAYNEAGEQTAAVMEAINKAGQRVTVTIKGIGTKEVEYSAKVGGTSLKVKELVSKLNELSLKYAEVDKARVRSILSSKSETQQMAALQRMIDSTIKKEKQLADAVKNREQRERLAAVATQRSNNLFASNYVSGLMSKTTAPASISGGGIVAASQQLTALRANIAQTKITAAELNAVMANLASGKFSAIPAAQQPIAAQLQQTIGLLNQLGFKGPQAWQAIGKAGVQAASSTLLSWKNFERFFLTHIAYTLFFQFAQGIKTGIKESIELQKRISEIRTITQDDQRTFAQYADAVRKVSAEAGYNIQDISEGLYETVSNQIATGERAIGFIKQAALFARVTNSSVEDSVNLLSSAINSYSLSALDAEKVSSNLFQLINLGRVRASELADTFGRVAVLSAQMGVTLDETSGALAVLTINGVRYSEAYTQVINLMQSFLKPTKAMSEFISSLGFESGEQLVRIKGFTGAMALLRKELDKGGVARIAELDDNIRGLRGAIGLIGADPGVNKYTKTVESIASNLESYRKAVADIAFESPAAQLEQEWNRLKNVFAIDVGVPAVQAIAAALKALRTNTAEIGGAAISALANPIAAIPSSLGLAWKIFNQDIEDASSNLTSFTDDFTTGINKIAQELTSGLEGKFKKSAEEAAANVKGVQDQINSLTADLPAMGDGLKDAFDKGTEAARKQYDLMVKLSELSNELRGLGSKEANDAAITQAKTPLAKSRILESQATDSTNLAKSALARGDVAEAGKQLATVREIVAQQQAVKRDLIQTHASTLADLKAAEREYASKLAEAVDTSERRKIRSTYEAQISELRRRSNDELYTLRNIGVAYSAVSEIFKSGTQISETAVERSLKLKDEMAGILDEQRKLVDAAREDSRIKGGVGQERLPDSGTRAIRDITDFDVSKFRTNLGGGRSQTDVAAAQAELNRLYGNLKAATFSSPAAYADAIKQADSVIARLGKITELKFTEDVSKSFRDQIAEFDNAATKINGLRKTIIDGRADFTAASDSIQKMFESVSKSGGPDATAALTNMTAFLDRLSKTKPADIQAQAEQLGSQFNMLTKTLVGSIDGAEAGKIFGSEEEYKTYLDAFGSAFTSKITELNGLQELNDLVTKFSGFASVGMYETIKPELDAIQAANPFAAYAISANEAYLAFSDMDAVMLQEQGMSHLSGQSAQFLADLISAKTTAESLDSAISTGPRTRLQEAAQYLNTAQTITETIISLSRVQWVASYVPVLDKLALVEAAYRRIASIVMPTPVIPTIDLGQATAQTGPYNNLVNVTGTGPVSQAQARLNAKAGGGTIGTDSVHALLSPGEFVINSQAAKRYYHQLTAINSGHRVKPMAGGGSVSVGDISVNMPSSSGISGPEQARQIATMIKREIQKGTVRL